VLKDFAKKLVSAMHQERCSPIINEKTKGGKKRSQIFLISQKGVCANKNGCNCFIRNHGVNDKKLAKAVQNGPLAANYVGRQPGKTGSKSMATFVGILVYGDRTKQEPIEGGEGEISRGDQQTKLTQNEWGPMAMVIMSGGPETTEKVEEIGGTHKFVGGDVKTAK